MNELAEIKMILVGISARLERIEQAIGTSSTVPVASGQNFRADPADFTTRQHVVMQGVVQGWDNNRLADWMGISPITVKTHLKGAADKLGVKKRAEVAVAAAAMFAETDPEEYLLASGGLPLDWAENAGSSPTGDEHRELYQPVKKQP